MSNLYVPLSASDEKIKRAKSKSDYLTTSITVFLQSNPYAVRWEHHGEFTYMIARLENPMPEDIPWELVEAVGHLRDALDKMMVELVELNRQSTSSVGFPFGGMNNGKPEAFPSGRMVGKGGIKEKVTPEQWALIVAQKPYPGGNDILWSVNQIANANKHWKGLVEALPQIAGGGDHATTARAASVDS